MFTADSADDRSRAFGPIGALFARIGSNARKYRTMQSLSHLSDRQLADVGLVRAHTDRFGRSVIVPFIE